MDNVDFAAWSPLYTLFFFFTSVTNEFGSKVVKIKKGQLNSSRGVSKKEKKIELNDDDAKVATKHLHVSVSGKFLGATRGTKGLLTVRRQFATLLNDIQLVGQIAVLFPFPHRRATYATRST